MTTEVVQIREGRPSDIPFVTNSWLKSFRANGAFSQSVPNDIYYQQHHKILESIIPRGLLLVLCNPEDPDQIIGWTLIERQPEILILHYIYIKNSLRRNGLMNTLLGEVERHEQPRFRFTTHMTQSWDALNPKKRGFIYNPYYLFSSLPADWHHEAKTDH